MKKPNPPAEKGFTLVEMLVVLAIIATLTLATTPAIESILGASRLSQGGQTLMEEINLARQIASAQSVPIQVRLIQTPAITPGDGYNAIQLFEPPTPAAVALNGGTPPPPTQMSQLMILPPSMVISSNTTKYSPLLGVSGAPSGSMAVPGGSGNYVSFYILPSGLIGLANLSTPAPPGAGAAAADITPMTALCLSVVPARDGNSAGDPGTTGAPSNYLMVQINPDTGNTLVYRP